MEAEGGPGCLVAQVGEITYLIARKSINEQVSTHGGSYWEERPEQTWGQEVGPCTGLGIGGLSRKSCTDFVLTQEKLAIQHLYCFCLCCKASPSPNGGCPKTLQSRLCLSSSCPWLLGAAGTHWAVANRHQLHVDPWLLGSAVPLSSTFCQRCF